MMSLKRIWAMLLRYMYFFGKFENIAENFYWPVIDILLWGITSVWIQNSQVEIPNLAVMILTAILFWQVIWRGSYEVAGNLLQEFWSRNFVNIFSTPLRFSEWVASLMLVGLVKISITVAFSSLVIWLFYSINVFLIGWSILPFIAMLMLSGWVLGLGTAAILIYQGQRVQMLAWMTPFMIGPISAVFYPLSALPAWAQVAAKCLPTTYVFEGMRSVLAGADFRTDLFLMSLSLNFAYMVISITAFKVMFEKSRTKGLSRLE